MTKYTPKKRGIKDGLLELMLTPPEHEAFVKLCEELGVTKTKLLEKLITEVLYGY